MKTLLLRGTWLGRVGWSLAVLHGCSAAPPTRAPATGAVTAPGSQPSLAANRIPPVAHESTVVEAPTPSATASVGEPPQDVGGTSGSKMSSDSSAPAPPRMKVSNIGLHIGGGPNDQATKAPFDRAIAREFESFRACCGKVASSKDAGARGTFGIDLLVSREGGHPETSNVRTAIPGDAFRDCVVRAFEQVTFDPPKHGATKLSYALKFDPERD